MQESKIDDAMRVKWPVKGPKKYAIGILFDSELTDCKIEQYAKYLGNALIRSLKGIIRTSIPEIEKISIEISVYKKV